MTKIVFSGGAKLVVSSPVEAVRAKLEAPPERPGQLRPFFASDGTVLINPASVAYIAESFY
jgi:hypothetical protein